MSRHDAGKPEQAAREAWLGEQARKPRRRRVVLADSTKSRGKALRTIIELEEQTSVGEKLVRDLIKQQLRSAFGLAFAVLIGMCLLPITFFLFPQIGDLKILGIPIPWLVLGLAPFPILYGVGWVFRRQAERHERDFVNMVDR
ncbi:hypothetical protein [Lentzea flava]|uniref:Holin-X, holin superfamily III n=1 Tax=Lentzea flava TaxID=103732 RepID=A0ABQ2UF00_9PSEU|nr:hypothetical protein [Lentzea flava]MCP2197679.1 hypothetical protein [Lentzea flava]GGU21423.1 hypothetical protein GCM10010178_12050 [Lentzea flava]